MPTVLRYAGFRFHFYSNENKQPPHIHVRSADGEAKFWLNPVQLASVFEHSTKDLRVIERLVFEYQDDMLKAYFEFHGE